MPVKRFSSGMYVRLAFSIAAHMNPEVLLVDEVLSVGDQAFQEKCLGRLSEVTNSGRTVLFVSHNLASLTSLCTRGILIEGGEVVMDGDIDGVINTYLSRRRRASGGELAGLPRDGTGEVRFREVAITGEDGNPDVFADRPVMITLSFSTELPVPAETLSLSVGVNHGFGERLVTLWNRFDPDQPLSGMTIEDGTVSHAPWRVCPCGLAATRSRFTSIAAARSSTGSTTRSTSRCFPATFTARASCRASHRASSWCLTSGASETTGVGVNEASSPSAAVDLSGDEQSADV